MTADATGGRARRDCERAARGRWADGLPPTAEQLAAVAALAAAAGLDPAAAERECLRLYGVPPAGLSRWTAALFAAWLARRDRALAAGREEAA